MVRSERVFEDWVCYLFDHPVEDSPWHYEDFTEHWSNQEDPDTLVLVAEYLGKLFRSSARLLEQYTPAQIEQGMSALIDPGALGHVTALASSMVPFAIRRQGILAIERLFEDLYAPSCSHFFCHIDDGPEPPSPLNSSCYMWWDVAPLDLQGKTPRKTDHLILRVQANILRLPSVACVESALHGLGHMALHYRRRVHRIIDDFLRTRADLPQCLLDYAAAARDGAIE